MAKVGQWVLGLGLGIMLTVGPFVYFRYQYGANKRLRIVQPGVLYRSGQLTSEGMTSAVLRFGIRTIINAQDEFPDPDIMSNFFDRRTTKESEVCRQLGVRYIHLKPDLVTRRQVDERRPEAIGQFLAIMDDPANHPVLLHCRAGLHRTGVLSAVYRMEYQDWRPEDAVQEMRDHGFGMFFCSSANDYVNQYVLHYRPHIRPAGYIYPSTAWPPAIHAANLLLEPASMQAIADHD